MVRYEKPIVLANEEASEGVYLASGDVTSDCWDVTVEKDQSEAGGYSTWRVAATHSTGAVHISSRTDVVIDFDSPVTSAAFEGFTSSVSGSTVTLTRVSHANGYESGDNFNSLLKIWAPNYATIGVRSSRIDCTHEVNVQGGFD